MNYKHEIGIYADLLIIESVFSDKNFHKTAQVGGLMSSIVEKVKSYVGGHIDEENKAGSVLNILAPGAITLLFKAMGFGKIGFLLGLLMNIFHVDTSAIFKSIYDKLKTSISGDKQISSSEVDSIVSSSIQEHSKESTQTDMDQAESYLQQKNSFDQSFKDARLVKLSILMYEKNPKEFKKIAFFGLPSYNSSKIKHVNFFGSLVSVIIKVILASAGLMIAGDIANKFMGRPNAIDGTLKGGKPIAESESTNVDSSALPDAITKQTKFKLKSSYQKENKNGSSLWSENIQNSKQNIDDMLVNFTKDVYDGLNGLDSIIKGTPSFKIISDNIAWHNRSSVGGNIVFIPSYFKSKKQIVDHFIDEVASSAT